MTNPKTVPVKISGTYFDIMWMDYGSFMRLKVFQNEKCFGHKDFPIKVEIGKGLVDYAIKKLMKEKL